MNSFTAERPRTSAGSGTRVATGITRLGSMDAYRGFVMLLMMAEILELPQVSANLPGNQFWGFLARQQMHVDWQGCVLHDLIQPSFSFLVGVALMFSLARRTADGQPRSKQTLHAFWRAMVLVLMGVGLRSIGAEHTNWTFEDTLTQIGLGYGFLYILALCSVRVQWSALAVILVGYWALFALYPLPGNDFDWAKAGVQPDQLLPGFAGHWSRNTNAAWAFDTWFLNLFPGMHFTHNRGGYSTLSFIPTLGTMILGLIAGGILRGNREPMDKVRWLAKAGVIALVVSLLFALTGICPIVKRIWTPSWVLFSGGIALLLLAGFYLVIDVQNRRAWAFPLVIVGMNSIAAYLMSHTWAFSISKGISRHFGPDFSDIFGTPFRPLVLGITVLIVEWLILLWMYRKRIMVRI